MESRVRAILRVVWVAIFWGIGALGLCATASATSFPAQIKPNPNYGYIDIFDPNTNDEHFDNFGTITANFGGVLDNYDTLDNDGTVIVINGGIFNNRGGVFDNTSGTLRVSLGGAFNNLAGAFNNTSGTVDNEYGATFTNLGYVDNTSGTFNNDGTFTNGALPFKNLSGGVIVNNGTFDHSIGTLVNEGIFRGTGTYIGDLDTGSGIVAPGNSAGTMYIDGDYTLGGTGTLQIEIGGFDPGEYDVLDITGTAYLTGGTIELMFLSGYDISTDVGYGQTMSLMFLEADGGIDSFASSVTYDFLGTPAGFTYDVYQNGYGLWFSATNNNITPASVPAPGALLLGLLGLATLRAGRRRFM
jgi:hypothetical protein